MAATEHPIMQTAQDIQRIARLFSNIADAYIARLKQQAPSLTQGEVYARLQEEQRLRSIANQLYFEAADLVLADAVADQAELEAQLDEARARLAKIEDFAAVLDLVADVLVLAGSLAARKPGPILAAIKEVASDLKEARSVQPAPQPA